MDLAPAPASLPPQRRIYAVGDIHGCARQLDVLHALIRTDLARRPIGGALLLHIGDLVDRGPDSAGVIARLIGGSPVAGTEMVNILGNHESTMLEALAGEKAAVTDWMFGGGKAALQSYGIDPGSPPGDWAARIPISHRGFLRGLPLIYREGGYAFVHAGVRPGVPLAEQGRDDLLRSRQHFLYSDADFGAVVVHGHTPVEAPVVRHNRIAIDTGGVFGGKLTCLVLEADRLGFLQADPVDEPVPVAHR